MRILHWYPNFLAGGAISDTVLQLANGQAKLGHRVMVVSQDHEGDPSYNPQLRKDLKTYVHAWQPTMTVRFGRLPAHLVPLRSLSLVRAFHADVLHLHNGIFLEDALVRLTHPATRAVLTPHGAFYPQALTRRMRTYIRLLKPAFYNRLTAFHALSPHEAIAIRGLFPSKKIYVVPNGLSLSSESDSLQVSDSGDPQRPIQLVCVGRLDIRPKGLDILLHGFARAAGRSRRALELVLVGPPWGNDYPKILEMIDELRIRERVAIVGAKDRQGVLDSLRAADVYVQMSRWDAFSLSAIEAMALELPCILSSGIGAVSYPGVAGFPHIHVTEPDIEQVCIAIQEVVRSIGGQREAARRFGPLLREQFSWERAVNEHDRAYQRLGVPTEDD